MTPEEQAMHGETQPEDSLGSVGQILQEERERQGLSEKQVADRLHITMHYVRALEANRFDKLPGSIFAKGYIKSYALLLGIDAEQVLARYAEVVAGNTEREKEQASQQQSRRRRQRLPLVAGAAVAAVLVLGIWATLGGNNGDEASAGSAGMVETAPVAEPAGAVTAEAAPALPNQRRSAVSNPPDVQDASANPLLAAGRTASEFALLGSNPAPPVARSAEPVSEAPTAEPGVTTPELTENPDQPLTDGDDSTIIAVISEGQDVLRIRFLGECWVEVNDDIAERGYRDLQHAGDVLEITGTAPFNILLGDAPYTRLSFNGAEIDVSDEIRIDNSARLTVGL